MKKIILLFALGSLLLTQTACGKLRDLVNASARLSVQVENLVKKNEESFDEKLYGKEIALPLAKALRDRVIPLAKNFNSAVRKIEQEYRGMKKIPASKMSEMRDLFFMVEDEIENALQILNVLTESQKTMLQAIIAAIRQILAAIGDAFSFAENFNRGEYYEWQS